MLRGTLEYNIRLMRFSDYKDAISLWKSLPGMGLSGADEPEEIHKFLKFNPNTCFVALFKNKLAGTILGGSDGRRGYIYHLAVRGDLQKMGVGRALLNRCLDAFRDAGLQKTHIFVIADNSQGVAFWEKMGWVKRDDILAMSKDLL